MISFAYRRASNILDAVASANNGAFAFVAGGTNLVDLVKAHVFMPPGIVDINALPLRAIEDLPDGGLRLGALATNADTAHDPRVRDRYPLLTDAILAGASAQLRNAATNGGNLNQRTRCSYFYDPDSVCNKRSSGSGCSAIGGHNRTHAILGFSQNCIATHPSDMCVALLALDAQVRVLGPDGERTIAMGEYHRLPEDRPSQDTTLAGGELVLSIDLPPAVTAAGHSYLKVRDRASYAFALVSVGATINVEDNAITEARIALGGVAHRPWRRRDVELQLIGGRPDAATFASAADLILAGAQGQGGNDFKVRLARQTVVRACLQAARKSPQSQSDKRIH